MTKLKIKGPFDREDVSVDFQGQESLTQQSMKNDCDVNHIMKRFEKTGMLEHVNRYQGDYGDFTSAPMDYQDALDTVIQAQEMFMSLPAKVRERFQNNPGEFLSFMEDPATAEEQYELGLREVPPDSREAPSGAVTPPEASPTPLETEIQRKTAEGSSEASKAP